MTFHCNCIKDAEKLEWVEIGMYGKVRKFKCNICGSIWTETKKGVIQEGEQ